MQVLVAAAGFTSSLRPTEVAAAIGRGIEAAGLEPPDLCPVADGGPGTLEVLLTRLGGQTAAAILGGEDQPEVEVGFAVIGDGSAAIVELAAIPGFLGSAGSLAIPPHAGSDSSSAIGELIAAAAQTGVDTVLVASGGVVVGDGGQGALEALAGAGGLHGARLVILCPTRLHLTPVGAGHGCEAGGIGDVLCRRLGGLISPGAAFVLDAVNFNDRMRAARALIVSEGVLDAGALRGRVLGEAATRARQSGVPTHAIVAANNMSPFDARILDLQEIHPAPTREDLTKAARVLAGRI